MRGSQYRRNRLVELISTGSQPVSVAELARTLSVTERTVRRDLIELRRSGVRVVSVPGRRGGITTGLPDPERRLVSQQTPNTSPVLEHVPHATPIEHTLIGRDRELAIVREILDAVAAGRGGTVTVLGEPGMGKTSFLDALSRLARDRGFDTAWCYNIEQRGRISSELWRQLLAGLQSDPDSISNMDTDSSQAYATLEEQLKLRSSEVPMVVVVDDLQWADEHSLDLIRIASHLLPDSNVVIAIGCREPLDLYSEAVRQTTDTLARGRHHTTISLSGLSSSDSVRLFETTARTDSEPPTMADLESLVERTGGNPMFVRELATARSGNQTQLPRRITEAVFHRYDALTEETRTVLLHAAVLGREFTLAELVALLANRVGIDISEALHQAAQALFVHFSPSRGGYEFVHDLLPEAIIEQCSAETLQSLHLATAEALLDVPSETGQSRSLRISDHFRFANLDSDDQRAIDWTLKAGHDGLQSMEWLSARSCFEWVISATAADDPRRADALVSLAHSVQQSYDRSERVGTAPLIEEAFQIYERAGMPVEAADAAAFAFQLRSWHRPEEQPIIERALNIVPENQPAIRARLLARLSICESLNGRHRQAEDLFQQGLQLAEQVNEQLLLARIWCDRVIGLNTTSFHEERYKLAETAFAVLGDQTEDYNLRHQVLYHLSNSADMAFRTDRGLSITDQMVREAEALGSPGNLASSLSKVCDQAFEVGDWVRARKAIDRTLAIDPNDARVLWVRVMLEAFEGNAEEAQVAVEQQLKLVTSSSSAASLDRGHWISSVAIGLWLGQLRGWEDELSRQMSLCLGSVPTLLEHNQFVFKGLALGVVAIDDESLAREVMIANLESIWSGGEPPLFGWVAGILAHYLGDYENAEYFLERSLGLLDRNRGAYWLISVIAMVSVLNDRGDNGDKDRARKLVADGLTAAEVLHAVPVIELLKLHLARIEIGPHHPLSERELEVLALVATGLSNQQVADELFLSRHTVNRHMSNILQKTCATGRTDAVARAIQEGVLSSK